MSDEYKPQTFLSKIFVEHFGFFLLFLISFLFSTLLTSMGERDVLLIEKQYAHELSVKKLSMQECIKQEFVK